MDWAWKDGVGGRMRGWSMDRWREGGRELGRGEWVEPRQMDESTTCVCIGLTDALIVRAT